MISINTLPDDVLLAIFNHYMDDVQFKEEKQRAWQSLVHVCRRWRSIVFESPRRLDLQLVCTGGAFTRDTLNFWPALPLIISCQGDYRTYRIGSMGNIIAALERTDRVCLVNLINVPSSDMEIVLAEMQQPFTELTDLQLWSADEMPVVPDSFLGGSAPRLECLTLCRIPFPGLPKLLPSATHLATLRLSNIPHSGYIPPNAMAAVLSTLTSLNYLELGFRSPRSRPDLASRRLPPSTRSVLPVFIIFRFKGVSEYLEDFVACIDAPKLACTEIAFFNDIIFDTPQLVQFISRTPKLKTPDRANIYFRDGAARVSLSRTPRYENFKVEISCKRLDWQLSSLEQVCTSCLPPLSMLEDLYLDKDPQTEWKDNIDVELWVELLRPFTTVKSLYLSERVAQHIVPALQELAEGISTEVLPILENMFLGGFEPSGPLHEGIGQFVAARQVAGRPIAVSRWGN